MQHVSMHAQLMIGSNKYTMFHSTILMKYRHFVTQTEYDDIFKSDFFLVSEGRIC